MYVIVTVAVIVIGLAALIASRPNDFRVERSAVMNAAPAKIFEQVNNLHRWNAWSPWARIDPAAKIVFEGPEAGVGALMRWAGNRDVGEGSMEIIESRPNEFIKIKLVFIKPFSGTNMVEFKFSAEGAQTVVSWSTYGKNGFMGKAVGLVMNCEKMIGGQYEKGLGNLKALVEAA